MIVYKYRSASKEILERELISLENNYFWASNKNELNDPHETTVGYQNFLNTAYFYLH